MFVSVLDEDASLMEIGVGNEIDQIRADMSLPCQHQSAG